MGYLKIRSPVFDRKCQWNVEAALEKFFTETPSAPKPKPSGPSGPSAAPKARAGRAPTPSSSSGSEESDSESEEEREAGGKGGGKTGWPQSNGKGWESAAAWPGGDNGAGGWPSAGPAQAPPSQAPPSQASGWPSKGASGFGKGSAGLGPAPDSFGSAPGWGSRDTGFGAEASGFAAQEATPSAAAVAAAADSAADSAARHPERHLEAHRASRALDLKDQLPEMPLAPRLAGGAPGLASATPVSAAPRRHELQGVQVATPSAVAVAAAAAALAAADLAAESAARHQDRLSEADLRASAKVLDLKDQHRAMPSARHLAGAPRGPALDSPTGRPASAAKPRRPGELQQATPSVAAAAAAVASAVASAARHPDRRDHLEAKASHRMAGDSAKMNAR
ncbi:unnamed protein product [Effrenium voratum]|nr:unnamed protein product [Effrenium voratum]